MADAVMLQATAFGERSLRVLALLGAVVLAGWLPNAVADDESAVSERDVKAAFLYKFAAYVDWPDAAFVAADSPIVIGVAGDEAIAGELVRITAGRQVKGRSFAIRRVADTDNLTGLHILFVGRADSARLLQFSKASQSRPILLVTEAENERGPGGIINFVLVDGHVRFWIANQEAERRGLKLSSRLLSVAQNVQVNSQ
jgi:prepilin-type processing-associated H-X9-DG protein